MELTYAEHDDGGASVEPSYDTMYKVKDPARDGGVVVHRFEELAAQRTPDFIL